MGRRDNIFACTMLSHICVNSEGPINYIFRNLWSLLVELFLSKIPKMSSKCKSQLTLEQRYALIKDSDHGLSQRKLAEKYKISVGAVNKNLKRKRDITDAHDLNLNPKTKQIRSNCKFEDINEKIFAWFQGTRARNIPISGPVILAMALEIAKSLGNAEFKGSNGWLETFTLRYQISFRLLSGESAGVDMDAVDS